MTTTETTYARLSCPRCGPIPDGELLGEEVSEVYDGVIIWQHLRCGTAWARFPSGRLADAAERILRGRRERADAERREGST